MSAVQSAVSRMHTLFTGLRWLSVSGGDGVLGGSYHRRRSSAVVQFCQLSLSDQLLHLHRRLQSLVQLPDVPPQLHVRLVRLPELALTGLQLLSQRQYFVHAEQKRIIRHYRPYVQQYLFC